MSYENIELKSIKNSTYIIYSGYNEQVPRPYS